jgi:hypothetical protein
LADVPCKALQPIIIYLKIEFLQHFSGFISAIWLNPQKKTLKALGAAYHSFVTLGDRRALRDTTKQSPLQKRGITSLFSPNLPILLKPVNYLLMCQLLNGDATVFSNLLQQPEG